MSAKSVLLICLAAAAAAQETGPPASSGAPAIAKISVNQARVACYHKFEVTFDLSGTWTNPFDPDQVSVDGIFQSPGGATRTGMAPDSVPDDGRTWLDPAIMGPPICWLASPASDGITDQRIVATEFADHPPA